jgi:hypothetical protein
MVRPCYGHVREAARRGITQWPPSSPEFPTRVSSSDIEIPSTSRGHRSVHPAQPLRSARAAGGVDHPRRPDPGRAVRRLAAGRYPVQLPWHEQPRIHRPTPASSSAADRVVPSRRRKRPLMRRWLTNSANKTRARAVERAQPGGLRAERRSVCPAPHVCVATQRLLQVSIDLRVEGHRLTGTLRQSPSVAHSSAGTLWMACRYRSYAGASLYRNQRYGKSCATRPISSRSGPVHASRMYYIPGVRPVRGGARRGPWPGARGAVFVRGG